MPNRSEQLTRPVFDDRERRLLAGRARSLACRRCHESDGELDDRAAVPDRGVSADRIEDAWDATGPVPSDLESLLADQRWPAGRPLPAWLSTAERVIKRLLTAGPSRYDFPDTPFGWIYARVADAAVAGLPAAVPESAVAPAVRWLVDRVHRLSRRLLYVAFRRHLAKTDTSSTDLDSSTHDDPPTAGYESFLAAFAGSGVRRLAVQYPVWARQLATLIRQWREYVTEIWERLQDVPAVFETSGNPTALRPLTTDTHDDGRVPFLVEFETGHVVYKPRPVDGLQLLWEFRTALGGLLSVTVGSRPPIRNKGDHAWVGVVQSRPLTTGTARQYYRRAGMTVALASLLGLTDCQGENLVADGAVPTVVDAETILQPTRERSSPTAALVDDTVLSTGLVPHRTVDATEAGAAGYDPGVVAGLGTGGEATTSGPPVPRLTNVNTDLMRVVRHEPTVDTDQNIPTVDGVPVSPQDHVDEIVAGFTETYHTLSGLCGDSESAVGRQHESPLDGLITIDRLRDVETRVLARTTGQYTRLLHRTTKRVHLASGVGFDAAVARLAPDCVDPTAVTPRDETTAAGETPKGRQFAAERRALWRRDVPRFSLSPDEQRPTHDGLPAGPVFSEDGVTALNRRIAAMDGADCRRQATVIRAAFDRRRDGSLETMSPPPKPVSLTDERLVDLAHDTLTQVLEAETPAGWVSVNGGVPVSLVDADSSLYYGVGGLLVAAAAVVAATDDSRARRAVPRLRDRLAAATDTTRPLGIRGVAGTVYAATVAAELTDDDDARRLATQKLAAVEPRRVAAADRHSVLDGTAGLLTAALAHATRTDAAPGWRVAHDCARRLLATRTTHDGHTVWETGGAETVVAGFAHGQSGIAAALARYARHVGDATTARVATDTLGWVRNHDPGSYDIDGAVVDGDDHRHVPSWCRGATGRYLARRVVADTFQTGEYLEDLPTEPAPLDSLCCGTLGRVDAHLFAARHGDGDTTTARRLLGRLFARRATTGRLELPGHDPRFPNVSLFHGVAGASYVAARVLEPSVPAVVVFE
jgi:type 2 lantibiotic biosynthesis protein LanM